MYDELTNKFYFQSVCFVVERELLQKGERRQKAVALEDENGAHSTISQSHSKCTPAIFLFFFYFLLFLCANLVCT